MGLPRVTKTPVWNLLKFSLGTEAEGFYTKINVLKLINYSCRHGSSG